METWKTSMKCFALLACPGISLGMNIGSKTLMDRSRTRIIEYKSPSNCFKDSLGDDQRLKDLQEEIAPVSFKLI